MYNVSVYILKLEISQINNLIVYTNVFKNKDKLNLKVVGEKAMKIRAEMNEI